MGIFGSLLSRWWVFEWDTGWEVVYRRDESTNPDVTSHGPFSSEKEAYAWALHNLKLD